MALTEITCPYCNNMIPTANLTTGRQWGFDKLFSLKKSKTTSRPSYTVTCAMCDRTYQYFKMQNYLWLKSKLFLSGYAIESFKSIVEQCGIPFNDTNQSILDWAFDHVVGVTSHDEKFLNVCFDYADHRIYFDCTWIEQNLSGLNAYKVY